ncbi:hypothetical protein X975_04066, partial [Stegodyphus mimosarum]
MYIHGCYVHFLSLILLTFHWFPRFCSLVFPDLTKHLFTEATKKEIKVLLLEVTVAPFQES